VGRNPTELIAEFYVANSDRISRRHSQVLKLPFLARVSRPRRFEQFAKPPAKRQYNTPMRDMALWIFI
jgi:hypothetical protein